MFVFSIVNFMVKATPVLSSRISLLTKDEGDFVGKGPSVSLGDTVQEPLVVPPVVSVPVSGDAVSFLHEFTKGTMPAMPNAARPFLKKSLRSIAVVFDVMNV